MVYELADAFAPLIFTLQDICHGCHFQAAVIKVDSAISDQNSLSLGLDIGVGLGLAIDISFGKDLQQTLKKLNLAVI